MFIRFIAHAGLYIEEDGYSLFLDPWFSDSTFEHPVIESIGGKYKTIDFQIPKSIDSTKNYAPDAICISHFHPHHSPAIDILALAENTLAKNKAFSFFYPKSTSETDIHIREALPQNVTMVGATRGEKFHIGPFTIEAKQHTVVEHLVWLITSKSGSVLHVADGRMNSDTSLRSPDKVWEELRDSAPSCLFRRAGGHSLLTKKKDGQRSILAAGIFTPTEAAEVVSIIKPRLASLIGIYNHSIWKNRLEYIYPAELCESEFRWALAWLAPGVRNIRLLPGTTFGIGEETLASRCHIYLKN